MSDAHAELLSVVSRLLAARERKPGTLVRLSQPTLISVCDIARDELLKTPALLNIPPPIYVATGLSGHFFDLLKLFETVGYPPSSRFLFLGGYVGSGPQNIESLALLLAYRILYPESVFLLRGPAEFSSVNEENGFRSECSRRYSVRLWQIFNDTFSALPIAASIGDKLFAAAGGPARDINIEFLQSLERPLTHPGSVAELFLSRPDRDSDAWADGVYGPKQAQEWLDAAGFDVFVAAGECGLEFPFEPERRVVRISSEHGRGVKGCVMDVGEGFECSFVGAEATERRVAEKRSEVEELIEKKNTRFVRCNRKW